MSLHILNKEAIMVLCLWIGRFPKPTRKGWFYNWTS